MPSTGEDNPASLDYRQALREVISRCVYAVDYNPDAVELCKVVLWIEGYCAGKPLSFLDHHIRCGNSVLGVSDLQMLIDGVPDKALTAEDKDTLKALKKMNQEAVKAVNGTLDNEPTLGLEDSFGVENMSAAQIGLADKIRFINHLPEDTLEEEIIKQERWKELMESARVDCLRRACDIYTSAFYHTVQKDELYKDNGGSNKELILEAEVPYTKTVMRALQEINAMECLEKGKPLPTFYRQLSADFKTEVKRMADEQRFFHWCVEFPEVFAANKGFDVMCGNPPWDKIKVEDKKWFESHGRADIVNAGTASQRKKAIADLPVSDPILYKEYTKALADAEALSRFVRLAGRFDLTATGDIDLYPMFAELCLSFSKEAWGLVMPTGIAVNDSNKAFFSKLIDENRLVSLYDFENREKLFDIDSTNHFCLLTIGKEQDTPRTVKGGFFLTRLDHLLDPRRIYTLQTSDFARLNPNTKTCPIFRTSRDAKLTAKIYRNSTILYNETTGDNPWNVKFSRMLDMSNDSYLFRTYAQLTAQGATLNGNTFTTADGKTYVPLYEGKMIWHYNHHYGTWPTEGERPNSINMPSEDELANPNSCIMPWYWVPLAAVKERLVKYDKDGNVVWEWKHNWILCFRDISKSTNERTIIATIVPKQGFNNKTPIIFEESGILDGTIMCGILSSIVFDYVTRQKVGGKSMNFFYVKQFPVLTPEQIPSAIQWQIVKRVAELCYFNHDMDGWASELWDEMNEEQRSELPQLRAQQPWIYDPERRAILQAELDAIFAHLYGLNTEDLCYILDPEDVCGRGCINETFRVLKDNEIRQYGEYRTKRLVLEAWNKFGYNN